MAYVYMTKTGSVSNTNVDTPFGHYQVYEGAYIKVPEEQLAKAKANVWTFYPSSTKIVCERAPGPQDNAASLFAVSTGTKWLDPAASIIYICSSISPDLNSRWTPISSYLSDESLWATIS